MASWPTAQHTLADGTVITFEYCCWTFCAWPELMKVLEQRWKQRVAFSGCNECRAGR